MSSRTKGKKDVPWGAGSTVKLTATDRMRLIRAILDAMDAFSADLIGHEAEQMREIVKYERELRAMSDLDLVHEALSHLYTL
jgi:hypothetical protein